MSSKATPREYLNLFNTTREALDFEQTVISAVGISKMPQWDTPEYWNFLIKQFEEM